MRFAVLNVRSLNRACSLPAAARELWRYKLDLVGLREVRWEKEGTIRAGYYNVFFAKGNQNHQFVIGCFVQYTTDWIAI